MQKFKWLIRKLHVSQLLFRLFCAKSIFGIEFVNSKLLYSTQNVREILTFFGANVHPSSIIHGPIVIHNADKNYRNLQIGQRVHVGREVFFDLTSQIEIQDDAVVSMRSTLLTHQDIGQRPLSKRYPRAVKKLIVGKGAYVGANSQVLCGAAIGHNSVIAAGSVVIKPVSPNVLVAGVPAVEKHLIFDLNL